MARSVLSWLWLAVRLTVTVLLVAFVTITVVLHFYPSLRQRQFASLCAAMTTKNSPEMTALRCNLLKDVHGDVLEMGPGAGANFVCLGGNERITSWTGIEPNTFMYAHLEQQARDHRASFPIDIVNSTAENVATVADGSMDSVVFTHLLCSCEDATAVVNEALRIVKPGGSVFFFEHVAAPADTWLHHVQKMILPLWAVYGDGCDFINTWEVFDRIAEARNDVSVEYRKLDAPIPLFLVKPHIIGSLTKSS